MGSSIGSSRRAESNGATNKSIRPRERGEKGPPRVKNGEFRTLFKFGCPWKLGNGILIPNGVVYRVLSMRGIEWRIEKVDRTTGKVRKVSL